MFTSRKPYELAVDGQEIAEANLALELLECGVRCVALAVAVATEHQSLASKRVRVVGMQEEALRSVMQQTFVIHKDGIALFVDATAVVTLAVDQIVDLFVVTAVFHLGDGASKGVDQVAFHFVLSVNRMNRVGKYMRPAKAATQTANISVSVTMCRTS